MEKRRKGWEEQEMRTTEWETRDLGGGWNRDITLSPFPCLVCVTFSTLACIKDGWRIKLGVKRGNLNLGFSPLLFVSHLSHQKFHGKRVEDSDHWTRDLFQITASREFAPENKGISLSNLNPPSLSLPSFPPFPTGMKGEKECDKDRNLIPWWEEERLLSKRLIKRYISGELILALIIRLLFSFYIWICISTYFPDMELKRRMKYFLFEMTSPVCDSSSSILSIPFSPGINP